MSEENVEIVRKNNDAFRRGDWEALRANVDPDVFVRVDPNWPEQRLRSGRIRCLPARAGGVYGTRYPQ
jgi:hypothetical protein